MLQESKKTVTTGALSVARRLSHQVSEVRRGHRMNRLTPEVPNHAALQHFCRIGDQLSSARNPLFRLCTHRIRQASKWPPKCPMRDS